MLSSITPLGERGRDNRWWRTVTAYIVGSIVGGSAMGAVLGSVGGLARQATDAVAGHVASLVLLVLVATLGLLADLGVGGLEVPTIRRQVDERWIGAFRGWVYGIAYGFQLGLGVVTIVTSSATWVTVAVAALAGSWWGGLAVGAAFGAGRAMPILLAASARSPGSLRDLHRRQQRLAPIARLAATGGQGLVAVLALLILLVTT